MALLYTGAAVIMAFEAVVARTVELARQVAGSVTTKKVVTTLGPCWILIKSIDTAISAYAPASPKISSVKLNSHAAVELKCAQAL